MYSILPSFAIGFHGCDKSVAEKVLSGKDCLHPSTNPYDWLGHGIYFWENNPQRAEEHAKLIKKHPERCKETVTNPAVVGAVIDLGHCLNLLDSKNLGLVKQAYETLEKACKKEDAVLPQNKGEKTEGLPIRSLDCAVINFLHAQRKELVKEHKEDYEFDTVRAVFVEGERLYTDAGFCDKSHIQICVRNPNSIKGYFRVVEPDAGFRIP